MSLPSVTAWSSLVFSAAARSACPAARISSSAVVTLASSTPNASASDFAMAASCAVRSGLVPSAGGVVGLFASRKAFKASVTLASSTPSLVASSAAICPRSAPRPCPPGFPPRSDGVPASVDEVALGEAVELGDGVVAAVAMLVAPSPAPSAKAPAATPSVILLVFDICLSSMIRWYGLCLRDGQWFRPLNTMGDPPQSKLFRTCHSAVKIDQQL
ncbi:exported hypothetical protein [Arthrobacter sp. 9V]|nr:exported hypothetical protein [Arthrobacter sp. 9V]